MATKNTLEVTGRWEDLVSRPEFCGHQVRITLVDQPSAAQEADDWLRDLHQMASDGVRISHPAEDSRESIYEESFSLSTTVASLAMPRSRF